MTCVDRVKEILKERHISVHKFEMDLGFANGYLGQLKKGTFPDDRLRKIADYLGVSATYLSTGEEKKYDAVNAELLADVLKDSALLEALKKYMSLSAEKKEHVLSTIDFLSGE